MATIMDSVVDEYYISLCGGVKLGQIKKIRQKGIQKIREIVGSYLCIQRFHKF